ncbi:MAG: hypothetical protein ACRELY_22025 [Polyangiaceae bacterium]
MKLAHWIALALVPVASGCILPGACGQCITSDGHPPEWTGSAPIERQLDSVATCALTASRNGNVIEFDIALDESGDFSCTKTGGDSLDDAGLDSCALDHEGAAAVTLDPADESFLGGFDFDFDMVCDGNSTHHSHETFDTTRMEC